MKELSYEDKILITDVGNIIVCYKKEHLENFNKTLILHDVSWEKICGLIEYLGLKNGSSFYIDFFKDRKWCEFYKIVGPGLMIFIIKKTLIFEVVSPDVFCPLNPDDVQTLIKKAEGLFNREKSSRSNEWKESFLKKLCSKSQGIQVLSSKLKLENKSHLSEQKFEEYVDGKDLKKCDDYSKKYFSNKIMVESVESEKVNKSWKKNDLAKSPGKMNKFSKKRNCQAKSSRKVKSSDAKSPLFSNISVSARKIRRGKKKKKIVSTSKIIESNTSRKRGFRETLFSASKFIYCRKNDDTWFRKHILTILPPTSDGAKYLARVIKKKDVGVKIPDFENIQIPFELVMALKKFIKYHKSKSKHYYKIILFNYFRIENISSFLDTNISNKALHNKLSLKTDIKRKVDLFNNQNNVENADNLSHKEVQVNSLIKCNNYVTGINGECSGQEIMQYELEDSCSQLLEPEENLKKLIEMMDVIENSENFRENIQERNDLYSTDNSILCASKRNKRFVNEEANSNRVKKLRLEHDKQSTILTDIVLLQKEQCMQHGTINEQVCSEKVMVQDIAKQPSNSTKRKMKHEYKFELKPVNPYIVKDYLRRILNEIIPTTIFGTSHNKKMFIRYCCKFVDSCKSQSYKLGTLMRKIKMSQVHWLNSVDNPQVKEHLLAKVRNNIQIIFQFMCVFALMHTSVYL